MTNYKQESLLGWEREGRGERGREGEMVEVGSSLSHIFLAIFRFLDSQLFFFLLVCFLKGRSAGSPGSHACFPVGVLVYVLLVS